MRKPEWIALAILSLSSLTVPPATTAADGASVPPTKVFPFTSNVLTGPFRGTQHCFVCDLADRPAILVFARGTDASTGSLLRAVRDAVRGHGDRRLFGWFVFPGERGPEAEERLAAAYAFANANDAAELPISVLGAPNGPPGYRIPPSARVTILLFRARRVLFRRSFTAAGWNAAAASEALADLPRLLGGPPPTRARGAAIPYEPAAGPVDGR